MNYDSLMKLISESSKSVKYRDRLQTIVDETVELSEDDLDLVAGGITIPKWNPEEE